MKDKIHQNQYETMTWSEEKKEWIKNDTSELVDILKESRDLLVMCTLIDKSGQCDEMVKKADKVLEKYK